MGHDIRAVDVEDDAMLASCFEAFRFLRPQFAVRQFIEQVRVQSTEGYRIVCLVDAGEVAAVAGYRFATFLAWGRVLYIDDLVTHPARARSGFASALLDWLFAEARQQGCDQIHLDSGYQRNDAHRLYLNRGFTLSSHHFSARLP